MDRDKGAWMGAIGQGKHDQEDAFCIELIGLFIVWGDFGLGDFSLGGFCPGGFCPGGFCRGGFVRGGFVQGDFVRGDFVLSPRAISHRSFAKKFPIKVKKYQFRMSLLMFPLLLCR